MRTNFCSRFIGRWISTESAGESSRSLMKMARYARPSIMNSQVTGSGRVVCWSNSVFSEFSNQRAVCGGLISIP
ncbi:hypothetical protein H8A92_32340 [Bradyrhizobium sp. 10BB]|nr:hypothetical protein [Bradyrhizobium acaciae]